MYSYEKEREAILTDEGQRRFLRFRDLAIYLIEKAGAVRMDKLLLEGDPWFYLACADRMIELGEIQEVGDGESMSNKQNRIFTRL